MILKMNTLSKLLLNFLVCFCSIITVNGQIDTKLSKQLAKDYKPTMKELKKKYGLSRVTAISYRDGLNYFLLYKKIKTGTVVGIANKAGNLLVPVENKTIFYKVENDGTRYFLLKNVYNQYGVSDLYGKTMIPAKYSDITYYPPLKKGDTVEIQTTSFSEKNDFKYHHDDCEGVFLAKCTEGSCLVSSDGRILRDNIKGSIERRSGYWLVGELEGNCGLLSSNGETIIPREYRYISIVGKVCYYEKSVDGIAYKGAITLDDSAPVVPCMFNTVFLSDNNEWFVKRRANDEAEKYDPDKNYNIDFRDRGEELYEKGKYDEVIDFYAKEGIGAPWAKFFTAVSIKNNAFSKHVYRMEGISECIEQNREISYLYLGATPIDAELAAKQFTLAKQMLEVYMEEDSTFYNQAKSECSMCDHYLSNMEKYKTRYKNALATLDRRNAAEAARRREEAARQEARRQQNAAIVMGILGGFAKALVSGSNSGSSSGKTYTTVPATRGSSSGKVNSTSSSSSSSSSSASTPAKSVRKVKCKACGGTGIWVDERISGDEKYCDRCGRMRKPHTHKTCASCKGTGYHE